MKEKGHSNALTMNLVARLDWKRTGDPMKHLSIQARNPTSVITGFESSLEDEMGLNQTILILSLSGQKG